MQGATLQPYGEEAHGEDFRWASILRLFKPMRVEACGPLWRGPKLLDLALFAGAEGDASLVRLLITGDHAQVR